MPAFKVKVRETSVCGWIIKIDDKIGEGPLLGSLHMYYVEV